MCHVDSESGGRKGNSCGRVGMSIPCEVVEIHSLEGAGYKHKGGPAQGGPERGEKEII